jgi:hypothetical protein
VVYVTFVDVAFKPHVRLAAAVLLHLLLLVNTRPCNHLMQMDMLLKPHKVMPVWPSN